LNPLRLSGGGLITALDELAAVTRATRQVQCTFRVRNLVSVPDPSLANHLYRIAQEAVQNALKHGRAKTIHLMLTAANGRLNLAVTDDGVGFGGESERSLGAGLENMRARARLLGAHLEIFRRKTGGTAVICSLRHDIPTHKEPRAARTSGPTPDLPG
jgi:signal transduction histidine kinase